VTATAVLFKDLQKLVSQQHESTGKDKHNELLQPFWIWDKEEHRQEDIRTNGDCCFNHIIGLPQKHGVDKPMYDYEKLIFDVFAHLGAKHVWIKKATGLGVTEFFLRFMAWLCLKDNALSGSQMCIVTGPNIDIAIKLIKRMKALFESRLHVTFDSKETVLELNGCTIEAYPSNHIDAYRALDNPKFILIDEGDFFRKGEQEDPGYGSSAFGIVVTQWVDDHIQILHAEEYHRPDYNEMLSLVYGLISKYQVDKVYIDGANPSFIKSLKLQIGEEADYDKVIARYKSEGWDSSDKDGWARHMRIVPVNFNKEHKAMLGHCKMILEETEPRRIAINPVFDKLITSLRTAVDADGTLDKESTSYNDIFDAFRLALKFYHFQERID
jgi:terminase large subunit-like protein